MRALFSLKSLGLLVAFVAVITGAAVFAERWFPREVGTESAQVTVRPVNTNRTVEVTEKKSTPDQAEMPPDRTIRDLVQTWNQGNPEDIASLFASDGTLIIPTGSQIQSRSEIKKTILEKSAGPLKKTKLTNTVDKVSRPDPETAVVQGTYKLDGIRILGLSTSATGAYVLRQIKREGRWLIARAEVMKGDNN